MFVSSYYRSITCTKENRKLTFSSCSCFCFWKLKDASYSFDVLVRNFISTFSKLLLEFL